MAELSILIADDHHSIRRSVRSLLESHAGWTVCGEASNGREAVEQAQRLRPDVVLIDVSMPEVDGLQATREIVRINPGAQVLLLTLHDSDVVAEEAISAGAKGALSKASASGDLVKAIESLSRNLVHLAGSVVVWDRHIAGLFRSPAERDQILGPFVAEGLSREEKTIHIIDPPDRRVHSGMLKSSGVDLDRAEREGTVRLIPWDEAYLRGDCFDQGEMQRLVQQLLSESLAQGFPRTRVVAHMEWALSDVPGVTDLIEYESRVNYMLGGLKDVVVCAYDVSKFAGSVIVDVIQTHPAILIGGTLHQNPFYVPPDDLIPALTARRNSTSGRSDS